MSAITTHVLDVAQGRPAAGIVVMLEQGDRHGGWRLVGQGATDADGRLRTLMKDDDPLVPGPYRLTFATRAYFEGNGLPVFYPSIVVHFDAADGERHYHVPLLLGPFGYTTYRGT